jgi:transmembrane sensor
MEQERLKQLTEKYHKGTLNKEERKELNDWFHDLNFDGDLESWISDAGSEELFINNLYLDIKEKLRVQGVSSGQYKYKWIAMAASILLCIGIGIFFIYNKKPVAQRNIAQNYKKPILPGSNKAILTLSNGKQILLSGAATVQLAFQGNTIINRVSNGAVIYRATGNSTKNDTAKVQYNILTTPRGGQHALTLSDGTMVWLNAASSIKFPVTFSGTDRTVEITGEVYFEVVHNAKKPFRVLARGETIEDLGTHFDVNAYDDEAAVKTTLIHGKVRVAQNNNSAILRPGEQSLVVNNATNSGIRIMKADTALVMAWKNGLFKFHNADLAEVMRQLARWYDVKVMLKGNISDRQFSGEITRDVNMSDVFEILSYLKVNFHVEQERGQVVIVVYPNK